VPSERDEHYKGNVAQYLLDLNDEVSIRGKGILSYIIMCLVHSSSTNAYTTIVLTFYALNIIFYKLMP